ncbi:MULTISPECIES: autotransporter outer membrane beta-barrel domain-containing protein [Stenotrophomonas]|uniref:autotransporter family protein n=2 Tax=Lysobacteraceae TaxID=32033 RepID=UPI001F08923B|nr:MULTISPECIES: autotransporter outer membrane beta-barrel domain-containing protein [Stenotrophomonas]
MKDKTMTVHFQPRPLTRRTLVQGLLPILITLSMSPVAALAGTVAPGTSHTVNEGDATDNWSVETGATLTLARGATSGSVTARGATLIADGASIADGLWLQDSSQATLANSSIIATGGFDPYAGVIRSGSSLSMQNMTVESDYTGFRQYDTHVDMANSTITVATRAFSKEGGTLELRNVDVIAQGRGGTAGGVQGILQIGGNLSAEDLRVTSADIGVEIRAGDAQMRRSTINSDGTGLRIGTGPGSAPGGVIQLSDSTISAGRLAAAVYGATLEISNSTLVGGTSSNSSALQINNAAAAVRGSSLSGAEEGVAVIAASSDSTLQLQGSSVSGGTGPGLFAGGNPGTTAFIDLADGSLVTGAVALNALGGGTVALTASESHLIGNLVAEQRTNVSVLLENNSALVGAASNIDDIRINDSRWRMTGDSATGRLSMRGSTILELGDGSTFNTLTVDEFNADGTLVVFNTALGDDTSATDKLVINGDANGQANVRVLNAGGVGAKTNRGIELIDIGGTSNAQFDLIGRAVGGQYEYFLVKDANGNWYLRSQAGADPDPCAVDPTLPECTPIDPIDPIDPVDPTPVLRPEAGAYLANQFAMDQLLRHGWRDRQGGSTSAVEGVRGWARVDATQSKLSAVEDQLDLRVDRSRLQLGADIGVFDNGQGRVGVMGTLAKSDATSRSQLTGYSARGKVNGGALGVYGNWSNDALYVDASVQRGQFRNRVQGEGLAEERYDSDIWQSSLEAGYRFGIGQIGRTALSLQPELQLVYTDASTDRHEETNGTVVRSLGDSGLSGRVGLRLQGESRSAAGASVSPYVVANWYRDGASNGMAFDDEALKASVPRNRYELNAGARVDFRSGLSAWGGFGVMRGDHGYREATANLSMSYRW